MRIRNRERLVSQGDTSARKAVVEVLEDALDALDVSRVVRALLAVERDEVAEHPLSAAIHPQHLGVVIEVLEQEALEAPRLAMQLGRESHQRRLRVADLADARRVLLHEQW